MGNKPSGATKVPNGGDGTSAGVDAVAVEVEKKSDIGADNEAVGAAPLPIPVQFQYQKGSCALEYWEPIKLLAEGSISDIHLVRRRSKRIKVRYKDKRDVMKWAKQNVDKGAAASSSSDIDELYVLKSIMKDHVGNERILDEMRREIDTLSHLVHPNIVRLVEAYERRRHIYLVMEYCTLGDLSDRTFPEPQTAIYIHKILSAVAYMHSLGVVHRDIKLENVMLSATGEIKIVDFGLATKYLSNEYESMTERVGTLYAMAPQVIEGVNYTSKCDIWSVGVVTYMLLSGNMPFWGPPGQMPWSKRRKVMMDRIKQGTYMKMKGPSWETISGQAKDFVATLLQLHPDHRPTASEALENKWLLFYQQQQESSNDATLSFNKSAAEIHQALTHFKQMARKALAEKMTEREIIKFRDTMESMDSNGDCRLELGQLKAALETVMSTSRSASSDSSPNSRLSETDVDRLFENLDPSSSIEYTDFVYEVLRGNGRNLTEQIAKGLDDLDTAVTRRVPSSKLQTLLEANDVPTRVQKQLWDKIDIDDDDTIHTAQVLQVLGKEMARQVRDSIRGSQGETELEGVAA